MNLNHKPATPLPFKAGTPSKGEHKIFDAEGRLVGEASNYSVHCFQQRDYLIHAASAYPRLIAQLRSALKDCDACGIDDQAADIRFLLSELGEEEQS